MKNFTDIYNESGSAATFTLGYGQLAGKLLVSSTFVDEQKTYPFLGILRLRRRHGRALHRFP